MIFSELAPFWYDSFSISYVAYTVRRQKYFFSSNIKRYHDKIVTLCLGLNAFLKSFQHSQECWNVILLVAWTERFGREDFVVMKWCVLTKWLLFFI